MNIRSVISVFVVVCAAVVTGGCATSTLMYTEPFLEKNPTSKTVNVPFDQFWDRYVADLAQTFFVINNISKESRIINVSFSANKPSEFVDCGISSQTWKGALYTPDGKLTYKTADSATYYEHHPGSSVHWRINRKTNLEGRFNVYLAPEGSNTVVQVKSRYIWEVRLNGALQAPAGGFFPDGTITVMFDSNSRGSSDDEEPVYCVSTGKLERELLALGD